MGGLIYQLAWLALWPALTVVAGTTSVDDTNIYGPLNKAGIQFSSREWSASRVSNSEQTYTWTQAIGANLIFSFKGKFLIYPHCASALTGRSSQALLLHIMLTEVHTLAL
jgi:hypothetical protein